MFYFLSMWYKHAIFLRDYSRKSNLIDSQLGTTRNEHTDEWFSLDDWRSRMLISNEHYWESMNPTTDCIWSAFTMLTSPHSPKKKKCGWFSSIISREAEIFLHWSWSGCQPTTSSSQPTPLHPPHRLDHPESRTISTGCMKQARQLMTGLLLLRFFVPSPSASRLITCWSPIMMGIFGVLLHSIRFWEQRNANDKRLLARHLLSRITMTCCHGKVSEQHVAHLALALMLDWIRWWSWSMTSSSKRSPLPTDMHAAWRCSQTRW